MFCCNVWNIFKFFSLDKEQKTEESESSSKDQGSRSNSPEKQTKDKKSRSSPSPKKGSPTKKHSAELREELISKAKKQEEERMKMQ